MRILIIIVLLLAIPILTWRVIGIGLAIIGPTDPFMIMATDPEIEALITNY